jgi:hypothetical protein
LTRQSLDDRTSAARMWDALEARLVAEIGGDITATEQTLIAAFCGIAIIVNDLTAKNLLGQPTSLAELNQCTSTLIRLASKLGINKRVPKDVSTPTLGDVLRAGIDQEHEHA